MHQAVCSANVLLDSHLNAKLAECGQAGMRGHGTPNTSPAVNLAVSCGTAAPELAWSLQFSPESDVYAFGVLTLELLTGRKPVDPKRRPSEQALVRWVRILLQTPTYV